MQIELQNLDKVYKGSSGDVHAVDSISLVVPSNTIYGIIGKSGAGKSSLVRLMSLLETPDSGAVFYGDKRVDNLSKEELIQQRRHIGMIFQSFNLFASRTASQNIAYPLEICGKSKTEIKTRVGELLELVGLSDRADSPISNLSGGQKQRIAIARSLANNPDILFCDEATSALDPQTTHSILELIRDIQKKMQLTVVMITHQMEVVRDVCERVTVLDNGRIVEMGDTTEIFSHPQSDVTKDFLSHLSLTSMDMVNQKSFVRWSEDGGAYTLKFIGQKTGEPVLSKMSKLYDIEFNIRAGGIQHLSANDVGTLLVDLSGNKENLENSIKWLKDQGVKVELTEEVK